MFMLAFFADQEILPMIDTQLVLGNWRVSTMGTGQNENYRNLDFKNRKCEG